MKVEDLDRLVEDALHEDAGRARLDVGGWRPTVGSGPRRRFSGFPPVVRRYAVAAVAAVVVIAGIAVPLAILSGLRGGPDGTGKGDPPAEGGYETVRDLADGISIRIPTDGTFREDPTEPIEPKNVLAIGSWAFPSGGVCEPFAALRDLPDDGAFFWLIEYHGVERTGDFVPRPERFELGERYGREFTCSAIRPAHQIRFHEGGRYLQLQIAFGEDASPSLEAEVLRAVDSLEIDAPAPPECADWDGPDCPQSAWVRAVIQRAGYEVTGAGPTAVLGRSEFLDFQLGTTGPDTVSPTEFGARLTEAGFRHAFSVDGIDVYSNGDRYAWTSPALHVWFRCERLSPTLPDVVRTLVDASLEVSYEEIAAG